LRLIAGCGCLLLVAGAAKAQDMPVPLFSPQPGHALVTQVPTGASTAPQASASAAASQQAGPTLTPQPADLIAPAQPADLAAVPQSAAPVARARPTKSANAADLESRVHELEAIVQQMQAQKGQTYNIPAGAYQQSDGAGGNPDSALPPPPTAFNPIASEGEANNVFSQSFQEPFKGFFFESNDKDFSLRLTGQIQLDYREFLNTKDRTDIDTFLLRRARFGLEATLFKYYEFRFLPDFGQGTTIVQDAYMNIHYWDAFQVETGRFKQPISYEQLIQDRYVPTLERSIIDQLVPARDLGAMIHGEDVLDNRLDYAVSASNGEINGNSTDLNNHKDVDGRIAIRPLNDPDLSPWLRGIQVGVSGGFGIEQEAFSPATLKTPDTVPFLNFNSTVRADGLRTRLSPEVAYFNGPFGFYAQYYDEHQDLRPSATGAGYKHLIDVPFTGYVFLGTLFLTGETRTTYSQQIFPRRNFDPRCPISCPGAWELVARVSSLNVGDVFEAGAAQLANPAKNSNEATEFTVGFNWYLNGWVRMQFNYEHDMFAQPVALGTAPINDLKSQDSVFTRFQVIF
jgi:phosphate-selective porin OprO/OprP